jgi:outer membrane protein TolC
MKLNANTASFILIAFFAAAALSAQTAVSSSADEKKQTVQTLTADDAVTMAIKNNVSIKTGQITLDAAKRADSHSWNSISPSASVVGGLTKPNDNSSYDYSTYLQAKVSLSLSPSLFTSIKAARLSYDEGKITYEETCRTIEKSVRSSFYGLLYENENLMLQQRNLETAKQQYDQNKAKYNQGRMSELDVLSAEVTYKNYIPTVEKVQIALENDMSAFKQMLGIDQTQEIELSGSLDDALKIGSISIGSVEASAPSIKTLEKELEAAKTAVTASRFSAFGPTIAAGWSYQPTQSTKDGTTSDTKDSGSLTLAVSVPLDGILPWSTGADKIATAKDTVDKLELQLADQKTTVKVNAENYLRQIKQLQSTIQSQQANVDLAQKKYDMTLDAYNHGTKDLLSLQDASDSLLEAKVSLKNEAYSLICTVLNLESTIGVPFGTLGK